MVKERVSATIDRDTAKVIERILENGRYRNKSHIIEDAIKLLEEKENETRR